jgi:hypothetical protein
MAKTILGSTFALLPTLQCLACFTKIYNIAHWHPKPRHSRIRARRESPPMKKMCLRKLRR